jgi:hypothetical protein
LEAGEEDGYNIPLIQFDWKVLYNEGNRETANILRTIVANATNCDAFFGPLFTTLAIATGPLIRAPQIDAASTSPELTDKERFPFYDRANDGQDVTTKLLAKMIVYFQWDIVNVLCTEETLGRAIAQTLLGELAVLSANQNTSDHVDDTEDIDDDDENNTFSSRIGKQHCVSSNPTREQVRSALLAVSKGSQIIVLALNHVLPAWYDPDFGILQQIKELGLHKTHVLVVPPDDGCSSAEGLEYALCLDSWADDEAFGPIYQEYLSKNDFDRHKQAFLEAGVRWKMLKRG